MRREGGYALPPSPLASDPDDDRVAEMASWLDTAAPLALDARPWSPAATTLIDAVTAMVVDRDATRRGPKGRIKAFDAVGAIVGGLLLHWSRPTPRPAYRSGKAESFSDGPIPYRQFRAAMGALVLLQLVVTQRGFRRAFDFGDVKAWTGKAARFWPSVGLLRIAASHGVTNASVPGDFTAPAPTKPPRVRAPIVVNSLKQKLSYRSGRSAKRRLPDESLGNELDRLRHGVEEANAFAAEHNVCGCLPPRWKRVFTMTAALDGRWTAVGSEGVYQQMSEADRLAKITINGEPVAEVDVSASHLSIMHGLMGLPLPEGDPYEVPGVPRSVVKSWVTATLGKASPVTRWAVRAVKNSPELLKHSAGEVGRLICNRYPFLRNPAANVAEAAGLNRLKHIGTPARLLTHRLMGIEAAALTGAMEYLRTGRGVLALPVHDSLIVPLSGRKYVGGAFAGAFGYFAKVQVPWTVSIAD